MEVVGVVFIATNHFLVVAPFMPIADSPRLWSKRSALAHQRLKSQRSAVTIISTVIVHLMCHHMSVKAVTNDLAVHPGWSARMLKMHFTELVTFGFFWFFFQRPDGPRLKPDGPSLVPDGARFSFAQSAVLPRVLHSSYPRLTLVLRAVRRKGPDSPRTGEFPKNFSCPE
jgi:hypothetical protein